MNFKAPSGGVAGMFIGKYVLTLPAHSNIPTMGIDANFHFTTSQKTINSASRTKNTGNISPKYYQFGYVCGGR
ncbi:MAG: hypothetical protein IJY78_00320 [Bacteroidaceae bacterium]|nr:hypothetical protein [Bacteroidaceae bacterium]